MRSLGRHKKMKKIVSALLLGALVLAGSTVSAQDTEAPVEITQAESSKVELLLSGYEYFPTREDLEKASSNAQEILIQIAENEEALPSTRLRAVDALGLFKEDIKTAAFFEKTLHRGGQDKAIVRHAMTSSLKAFGQQALPWVQPYLGHQDLQMRISAVHAVGRLGGVEGVQMLQFQRQIEPELLVRQQMVRFLR